MLQPRIAAPWLSAGFLLHDASRTAVANVASFRRAELKRALECTGFRVDVVRTTVSIGSQAASSPVTSRKLREGS
jgi:hypothetical protein